MKRLAILAAAVLIGGVSVARAESLAILPGNILLSGPESSQRILVEKTNDAGEFTGEISTLR